jgi:hypothetical protein
MATLAVDARLFVRGSISNDAAPDLVSAFKQACTFCELLALKLFGVRWLLLHKYTSSLCLEVIPVHPEFIKKKQ